MGRPHVPLCPWQGVGFRGWDEGIGVADHHPDLLAGPAHLHRVRSGRVGSSATGSELAEAAPPDTFSALFHRDPLPGDLAVFLAFTDPARRGKEDHAGAGADGAVCVLAGLV